MNDSMVGKPLSDREEEVFCLYGLGRTTKEVAESLEISKKTVEAHRAKISCKLNLQTTAKFWRSAVVFAETGKPFSERDGR